MKSMSEPIKNEMIPPIVRTPCVGLIYGHTNILLGELPKILFILFSDLSNETVSVDYTVANLLNPSEMLPLEDIANWYVSELGQVGTSLVNSTASKIVGRNRYLALPLQCRAECT